MQISEPVLNTLLIIVIIALMIANFFVRKAKMERSPLGRVVTLLDEMRRNEKMIGNFINQKGKITKYRTRRWNGNRNKIDFVPTDVVKKIVKAYEACDEANLGIEQAKKAGSSNYLASLDINKVKEPLTEGIFELREWLRTNMDNPAFAQKKKGLLGGLFGGGGGLFGGK